MTQQNKAILQALGIKKFFKKESNQHLVLDHIDFTLFENEVVCLLGKSGSGKSTFLRIISGLTEPSEGKVAWQGKEINSTINAAQLTETERKMADDKIFNLRKEANDLRKEDAILYKDMSKEDVEKVIKLNRRISLNRDRAIDSRTEGRFKHQNISHIQFISNTDNQINGIDFFFHQSVFLRCWYSFISTLS